MQESGLFFAVPVVDQLAYLVDLRELCLPVHPISAITRDNVSVSVGGALYVQVVDALKAVYGVRRVLTAIHTHSISAMRTAVGGVELDALLHNRLILNQKLREAVAEAASMWGLEVRRLELTEVHPDVEVSRAMDAQATAERRKREAILNAEAVREQHIRESQGVAQETINVAESRRQAQVLEASGHAESLKIIADVLEQHAHGRDAMNFSLAEAYVNAMAKGLSSSSTVFMNEDISNPSHMIAKGMGVLQAMSKEAGGGGGGGGAGGGVKASSKSD